jgi:drug/metabolite transporter (DMT)-like permease
MAHSGVTRTSHGKAWVTTAGIYGSAMTAVTLFSLTPTLTRVAVHQVDPLTAGLIRTVMAAPVATAILCLARLPRPSGWRAVGMGLVSAGAGYVAFPILFCLGAHDTSATHAAVLMAAIPLFTMVIDRIVDRTRPNSAWVLGTGLALGGVVMVILGQPLLSPHRSSMTGDGVVLASVICVAAGFVAGSRLAARIGSWAATFWSIACAGWVLAPWLAARSVGMPWASVHVSGWLALATLTFGNTIIGWIAWFFALARGGVQRIAPLMFLVPILAVVVAVLVLGNLPGTATLVGGVVTVVGIGLARRSSSKPSLARGYRLASRWLDNRDAVYFASLCPGEIDRLAADVGIGRSDLLAAVARSPGRIPAGIAGRSEPIRRPPADGIGSGPARARRGVVRLMFRSSRPSADGQPR